MCATCTPRVPTLTKYKFTKTACTSSKLKIYKCFLYYNHTIIYVATYIHFPLHLDQNQQMSHFTRLAPSKNNVKMLNGCTCILFFSRPQPGNLFILFTKAQSTTTTICYHGFELFLTEYLILCQFFGFFRNTVLIDNKWF